ncbi:potassium channel AKT6 isoform X1 [Cajanus cajan]|uniref:potassium channel AKT6 isoform X1 n=1 Tax=Cajanus cajan TaxID=3821 RepID=UPI0010FB49AB|nr:potassium channel AKT6 isoform X1 [Cajanus cajan]
MKMFRMCGGINNGYYNEDVDERELDKGEDGSKYSLTGILLPSLGATAARNGSRRLKLGRYIISPANHQYRLWSKFLVILVFYTAWMCPFQFGFLERSKGALAVIDNVVNGFFAIDIVLTFFVAYLDKSTYLLIDNHKLIALRYAKSWLVFDVIATTPYEVVHTILPPSLQIYSYFSILRLWRLHRVSAMFARLEKDRNYSYFWVRCCKLTCRDTVQSASNFAKRNQLPVRLQEQMFAHLLMKYRTDLEGLQQQEIIDSLPKAIQSSISHYLFYPLVDKVYLFHGVSNDLLFQLVTEMKAEYFPPKEDVILQNEAPTDFYIFVTGAADLIIHRNGIEQVVGEAKPGDVVGETGVLCYMPQLFTVRTKRLSQILRLNRTIFLNLTQSNVGDGTMIMNNYIQHLHEFGGPLIRGILENVEGMLARGKMDLPISLLFAVSRDDDLLLRKLLKKGSDPNEVDKNGKTALHLAAFKGNNHCVSLLLEHGAKVNIQDSDGNVPLWEAIKGGHESIMKLLIDNGADISCADVGHFACTAVEQNNLELLKGIVQCGGDVTQSTGNGTTALHAAVCEGNVEIVKFLLEQGADIDKQDNTGLTPRFCADQQCHEEILKIFQNVQQKTTNIIPSSYVGRCQSEPTMPAISQGSEPPNQELTWFNNHQRRRASPFHNSFFGILSNANYDKKDFTTATHNSHTREELRARVTLSCPEKGECAKKLVFLPNSIEELLHIGAKKFDFYPTKILTKEGAEVEDINVIRDGDFLIFV